MHEPRVALRQPQLRIPRDDAGAERRERAAGLADGDGWRGGVATETARTAAGDDVALRFRKALLEPGFFPLLVGRERGGDVHASARQHIHQRACPGAVGVGRRQVALAGPIQQVDDVVVRAHAIGEKPRAHRFVAGDGGALLLDFVDARVESQPRVVDAAHAREHPSVDGPGVVHDDPAADLAGEVEPRPRRGECRFEASLRELRLGEHDVRARHASLLVHLARECECGREVGVGLGDAPAGEVRLSALEEQRLQFERVLRPPEDGFRAAERRQRVVEALRVTQRHAQAEQRHAGLGLFAEAAEQRDGTLMGGDRQVVVTLDAIDHGHVAERAGPREVALRCHRLAAFQGVERRGVVATLHVDDAEIVEGARLHARLPEFSGEPHGLFVVSRGQVEITPHARDDPAVADNGGAHRLVVRGGGQAFGGIQRLGRVVEPAAARRVLGELHPRTRFVARQVQRRGEHAGRAEGRRASLGVGGTAARHPRFERGSEHGNGEQSLRVGNGGVAGGVRLSRQHCGQQRLLRVRERNDGRPGRRGRGLGRRPRGQCDGKRTDHGNSNGERGATHHGSAEDEGGSCTNRPPLGDLFAANPPETGSLSPRGSPNWGLTRFGGYCVTNRHLRRRALSRNVVGHRHHPLFTGGTPVVGPQTSDDEGLSPFPAAGRVRAGLR